MTTMEMVKQFAETVGQKRGDPVDLYEELIKEEYWEWDILAFHVDDKLSELCDLVYVIYGYCYHRGWDLDEAIKRRHEDNIFRFVQADGTIKRDENGRVLYREDYKKEELGDLADVWIYNHEDVYHVESDLPNIYGLDEV